MGATEDLETGRAGDLNQPSGNDGAHITDG